jgi:hypothetical protein
LGFLSPVPARAKPWHAVSTTSILNASVQNWAELDPAAREALPVEHVELMRRLLAP